MAHVYHIGVILPSSNAVMEQELCYFLRNNLIFHYARVKLDKVTPEAFDNMKKDLSRATQLLAGVKPIMIGYGCMSIKEDSDIAAKIKKETGIPAVTVAQAVFDALHSLEIKKIAYISPTTEEVDYYERKFIEENGFKIVRNKNMNIFDNREIANVEPHTTKKIALSLKSKDIDGFFISCTNLRVLEEINEIEEETNLPVVAANQAFIWKIIKEAKISTKKIKNLGQLFELH